MIRALYTASSGLVAQSVKQDVIANNIANAQTSGFQRKRVVTASFAQSLKNQTSDLIKAEQPDYPDSPAKCTLVSVAEATDTRPGTIVDTGGQCDFALDGPGEFEVVDGAGGRQVRSATFHVDASGELCTADGAKVQGQNGPVKVPLGEWSVSSDGSVVSEGSTVDKLRITGAQPGTRVMQGCLEGSNVNIVTEMVDMIANVRAFEANQRVVSSIDQSLNKMINEGGKV